LGGHSTNRTIKEIVSEIKEIMGARGGLKQVYFVACGGSKAAIFPGLYLLQSEAKGFSATTYTSNEKAYAENFITIDFQEINGGKFHECVAEFFSPVAMISVERHYVSVLAQLWGHSMDERRYMGKAEY